ncbi:hypothetical protein [Clavibacter tessellarius]|uniref:hypothetical protein n=1 Tax=Clavibacter tessellarius TaxID=31965 RepID=UPI00324BFF1B
MRGRPRRRRSPSNGRGCCGRASRWGSGSTRASTSSGSCCCAARWRRCGPRAATGSDCATRRSCRWCCPRPSRPSSTGGPCLPRASTRLRAVARRSAAQPDVDLSVALRGALPALRVFALVMHAAAAERDATLVVAMARASHVAHEYSARAGWRPGRGIAPRTQRRPP